MEGISDKWRCCAAAHFWCKRAERSLKKQRCATIILIIGGFLTRLQSCGTSCHLGRSICTSDELDAQRVAVKLRKLELCLDALPRANKVSLVCVVNNCEGPAIPFAHEKPSDQMNRWLPIECSCACGLRLLGRVIDNTTNARDFQLLCSSGHLRQALSSDKLAEDGRTREARGGETDERQRARAKQRAHAAKQQVRLAGVQDSCRAEQLRGGKGPQSAG
eukprot:scaffold10256_cov31-Tisochrysis_lutea.AAC.1